MNGCKRCDFDGETHADLEEHAAESGHYLCVVCQWHSLDPYERQTCLTCLAATRTYLVEIAELYELLPEETTVHAASKIPGGDALVMLAGGNVSQQHLVTHKDAFGRFVLEDEVAFGFFGAKPDDPESVAASLGSWQDDWLSVRDEPAADEPATVASCAAWLMSHHTWAAQHHPAFDEYESDLRRIRGRMIAATSRSEEPEHGVPCLDCGASLTRAYEPPRPCSHGRHPGHQATWDEQAKRWVGGCQQGGLTERWSCSRCRREYGEADFRLAIRSANAAEAGWVPVHVAADVVGRSVNTVRSWVRELRVGAMCPVRWRDGKPLPASLLVRWADVHDLATTARRAA